MSRSYPSRARAGRSSWRTYPVFPSVFVSLRNSDGLIRSCEKQATLFTHRVQVQICSVSRCDDSMKSKRSSLINMILPRRTKITHCRKENTTDVIIDKEKPIYFSSYRHKGTSAEPVIGDAHLGVSIGAEADAPHGPVRRCKVVKLHFHLTSTMQRAHEK